MVKYRDVENCGVKIFRVSFILIQGNFQLNETRAMCKKYQLKHQRPVFYCEIWKHHGNMGSQNLETSAPNDWYQTLVSKC